jgi:AbrB family looped-hinge helix DNA binding protein
MGWWRGALDFRSDARRLAGMNAQTRLSGKGQVIIPKDVRDALHWEDGLELEVVKGANSVTLKPKAEPRERITFEEFKRRLPKYDGPYIPEEEWAEGIADMFRREWK